MTVASTDYHDYVFKDGELVGDFEGMYRHSVEVPWQQDRTAYEVGADIDIAIMGTRRYRNICDAGCGLGYFTNRMSRELQSPTGDAPAVTGLDTSSTAIESAYTTFPRIRFAIFDFLSKRWDAPKVTFDLVVARDVLWYVCKQLDRFLLRLVSMVNDNDDGGCMHITQSFPSSDRWVGKDVIASPEDLLGHLQRVLNVTYSCIEHDVRWSGARVLHVFGEAK